MKKFWFMVFLGLLLLLGSCSGQQDLRGNAEDLHDNSLNTKGNGHDHGQNNVDVIPSVDREKKQTTAADTASEMGANVYSLIGSSSLHDGGISSHLESRLAGEGITGIKVFVLDDTIILARATQEATSTRYDDMQNKVLRNTSGLSGKGDSQDGVDQPGANEDDNLAQAKELMNKAFNGQVQVLTITNPKALPLIDGIKANIKSASPSYSQLSSDIITLVKMANEK
jgi:hypothetical protein